MKLGYLKCICVIIIFNISTENVSAQLLPPGITLPPWLTIPPGITLPGNVIPDNYMLIHQALITPRGSTNLDQHLCGGTLVLNFTVITSANCLLKSNGEFYDASELSVALGFHSIPDNNPAVPSFFDVREVVIHGRFNRRRRANNVALLRLSGNMAVGDRISPTLPSNSKISISMECILLGYKDGTAKITEISPKYHSTCTSQSQENWPLEMFCSGDSNLDTCSGTEGSGLICGGLFQGIVTRSCAQNQPMQYTDASQFFFWMGINQLDENPYRLMDNDLVRYFLFGSLDFIAWLIGTPSIADKFDLVKFFF